MRSEEFMESMLNGIVEKKISGPQVPDVDGYKTVDGPPFLRFIADYIEQSDIKFCTCDDCPDANRGNVIDGLRQTAVEIEVLRDSYTELSEMYDGLLGDSLEETNGE